MLIMLVKWLKPSNFALKQKGKIVKIVFQTHFIDYSFISTSINSKVIR